MKVDGRFEKVTIGASAAASGLPNRVNAWPPSDCATVLAKSAENCGPSSLTLIQNTAPRFEAETVAFRKRMSAITRCEKSSSGRVSIGVCMADHQDSAVELTHGKRAAAANGPVRASVTVRGIGGERGIPPDRDRRAGRVRTGVGLRLGQAHISAGIAWGRRVPGSAVVTRGPFAARRCVSARPAV